MGGRWIFQERSAHTRALGEAQPFPLYGDGDFTSRVAVRQSLTQRARRAFGGRPILGLARRLRGRTRSARNRLEEFLEMEPNHYQPHP
jgi:hypothetical protein